MSIWQSCRQTGRQTPLRLSRPKNKDFSQNFILDVSWKTRDMICPTGRRKGHPQGFLDSRSVLILSEVLSHLITLFGACYSLTIRAAKGQLRMDGMLEKIEREREREERRENCCL